jgi:inner membrane protein
MFNSTHTFVGLAVARSGVDKWAPHAAATAVIASNLPDIDIITMFSGTAAYIDLHRGITHTLMGVPVLALLLAAAMSLFTGKFWRTYAVALIAMATHPLLDYANTYGLRPFLPFDGTWYYGDVLFIIDPYIDLVLLLGIVVGQRKPNARRMTAWLSIAIVVAYIGMRTELHAMAASKLAATAARIPGVVKSAVFPTIFDPLRWEGIIETKTSVSKIHVHALRGPADADELVSMDLGPPSEIVTRASTARSAATLLRFARFPVTRVERLPPGYRVTFLDFRFYSETTNTALASEVILDESLHVVQESMSFVQRLPARFR